MKRHIFWGITLSVWAAAVLLAVLAAYAVSGTVIETPFTLLFVAVFLAAPAAASIISRKITAPLAQIDPENPPDAEDYPELGDMLHRLHRQNELIGKQMNDLRRQREEFRAITENMDEGFILIDKETEILSYNASALRHLGRDKSGGGSVFDLNRSAPFCAAVGEALMGQHNEKTLEHDGRVYQLIANPVTENGQTDGAVIVILDITEKRQREQMRREFTSNVSHELKTPLTSIYGISDMLRSGMVKAEDISRFAETIHKESGRMITLVEDTIRLSQLDEDSIPYEKEDVDLYAAAAEILSRLRPAAECRSITLSLAGESHTVYGVRTILWEIVSNLCDNAVKYNRDGGSVSVCVTEEAGRCALIVADTGIGIPREHLDRVCERFYRVDKSHSRAIGGTGLGLSIVKHGVAYHGGEMKITSVPDEGTTVKILF
ncbi:MAG: PAS domain-containing protein [Ruminococcaceae bacterium]|nr:PAS domain-containing protein [Oscillospiraceae bacterium]